MKKIFYAVAVILIACNNESKDEKTLAKTSAPETISTSGNSGPGCGSLVLFRKGAVIETTNFDAAGKEVSKQITTVKDVIDEGGITIASSSAQSSTPGSKPFNLIYKCDGKNLYMDLASMMQNLAVLKDAKADVKTLAFPLNIKEGETLPESSVSVAMDRGAIKMNIKTTYKNRTVGAKEKITTPAGSWNCYKINNDIESTVDSPDEKTKKIMDAVNNNTKMRMVFWYAPEFGFVKMETYRNDKLTGYNETTAVK
ncbi:MAG: hypothetical protein ABJA78_17300 [Ferruginibacter sp.]